MLIDSNIFIYALNDDSPKQKIAQAFIRAQKELVTSQQNIFETIRVITHQKFPHPFTGKKAVVALEAILAQARVVFPNTQTQQIALQLITKYDVQGSEIFDAHLVATALSHNIITIATDNVKHLKKYNEISVVNPFA